MGILRTNKQTKMSFLDTHEKCCAFTDLMNTLVQHHHEVDFSEGMENAMGYNERANTVWIMMDAGDDYRIQMFIKLDDGVEDEDDEGIKYCWGNRTDCVEHIDEDFNKIYNIAREYYQSLEEED